MVLTAMWQQGPAASRPAPGVINRIYLATDTGRMSVDTGTSWINATLNPRYAYDPAATYNMLDLVTSGGSAFVAKANGLMGITPVDGASWALFAGKGDQGIQGIQGVQGVQGFPGYSITSNSFTQPAVGSATGSIPVGSSTVTTWMTATETVYVAGGGYYTVTTLPDSTHVTLTNLGAAGNASPGATVPTSALLSPAGPQGIQGPTGSDMLSVLTSAEVSVTGTTTLTSTAFGKMHVLTGASNYTVTLPAPSARSGSTPNFVAFRVPSTVTDTPGSAVAFTVSRNSAETIDGQSAITLVAQEAITLETDGTNWFRLNGRRRNLVLLDYVPATDVANGITMTTAGTFYDLNTNQSFTVIDPAALVKVMVICNASGVNAATSQWGTRLNIDSAGTPITRPLGTGYGAVAAWPGSASFDFGRGTTNGPLATGAHTAKTQIVCSSNSSSGFCRPSSQGPYEALRIMVTEMRG